MRQVQREKKGRKPRKTTKPLAEGIRKIRPRYFFTRMSDEELIEYARRIIRINGLNNRSGLRRADGGLYQVLNKRNLMESLFRDSKRRSAYFFSNMSDDELVEYAKKKLFEKKLKMRSRLQETDMVLYQNLRRRGLLDRVIPTSANFGKREARAWASMSDDELVEYARELIKEKGVASRRELAETDSGLYDVLRKRRLLNGIGLEKKQRNWAPMSDEKLVEYAKNVIDRENITGRKELRGRDSGLYDVLRKRQLLGKIGFEAPKKTRDWASMSDEKLVEYAKNVIDRENITGRKALATSDYGLYSVLIRRNLIEKIGLVELRRDWKSMDDKKLVKYARKVITSEALEKKKDLLEADGGLYQVLSKRKLLMVVFAAIETKKKRKAVQEVVDAMAEFDSS